MKAKKWIWGIFFIVAALLVIANQMGYFTGISLFSLLCTILLIPVIITSAMHLNFGGIFIPLALLGIIYAEPLGIQAIVPWPILAAALFLSIGFTILIRPKQYACWHNEEHFEEVIDTPDGENVNYRVNFGSGIKYINAENFKKANLKCSFGALKVYFTNAKIEEGTQAEIYLNASFGGVEIYVPKEWKVINNTNASFGGIEEKNARTEVIGGPTVKLKGNVQFAGVEIIYI